MSQDDLVEISFETSFSSSTLECLFFPPSKVPLCLNDLLEEINTKRQKCKENKFFRKNNEYHLKEVQTNSKTKKKQQKTTLFYIDFKLAKRKKELKMGSSCNLLNSCSANCLFKHFIVSFLHIFYVWII